MRPIQHLPIKLPYEYEPEGNDWFYKNIAKHLIKDVIRIMNNGIAMDFNKVKELENTIENVINKSNNILSNNPLIQKFLKDTYHKRYEEFKKEKLKSLRTIDYYLKSYTGKVIERTYLVNLIVPNEDRKDKWTIKDIKKYYEFNPIKELKYIIEKKELDFIPDLCNKAMEQIAKEKVEIWNKVRYDKLKDIPEEVKGIFNPASSKQKAEFFEWYGIEPLYYTEKGQPKWNRTALEELLNMTDDNDLKEVIQALIDYSYSAIIRDNFIKAFYNYTINDRLYGNLNLFGALSFRLTSKNPNLLNMPSTGSIYAKPIKRCFVAPKGKIILQADLSALEDRVIANLSKDSNKISIFTEGIDGHSLNACYYFKEEIEELIGKFDDYKEGAKKLKKLVDEGNKKAKEIRQKSKPITFGLAYGAFPSKIAESIKCSLEEAETIFNRYHNELFKDITKYREEIIYKQAIEKGYVHCGLGFRVYVDNPDKDIRSYNNATIQFWSILTLLAINELHYRIDKEGLSDKVKVISTIYDAIYIELDEDIELIKWVNDNLIELMTVQYLEDEIVHNEAESEIGYNWTDTVVISNNASIEEIKEALNKLKH